MATGNPAFVTVLSLASRSSSQALAILLPLENPRRRGPKNFACFRTGFCGFWWQVDLHAPRGYKKGLGSSQSQSLRPSFAQEPLIF